jgi:hypothetical protein
MSDIYYRCCGKPYCDDCKNLKKRRKENLLKIMAEQRGMTKE